MRIGIIGAGPAGLSAAYELAKSGQSVTVFEAGPRVGGMVRSFDLWGQRVDIGPHRFFSKDARVNRLWLELIGSDYRMVDRRTRILYRNKFYNYPLSAKNALGNMGLYEAAACVASYAGARLRNITASSAVTFEDWIVSRFGRRLFEMFFRSYSEKLWGVSCRDLNADFAAQRIKSFSLAQALLAMTGLSGQHHRTLADVFAYPCNGSGEVYERMARRLTEMGGVLHLKNPVHRVDVRDGVACGIVTGAGETYAFDHVITTMPLPKMVAGLPGASAQVLAAAKALRFRNTILVYLRVDHPTLFPDQWLYIHSPELRMGRITNFRNWAPDICRGERSSILAAEFWCNDDEPLWSETDDNLIEMAKREVASTGLAASGTIREGKVIRVPQCYPVYAQDYRRHLDTVIAFLNTIKNLWPIGRYGSFKYNNQDHSILMGLLTSERILGGVGPNLWTVNSDDEYQESSTITASGLTVHAREGAAATP